MNTLNKIQENYMERNVSHEVKNDVTYKDGFHFYFEYQNHIIHAYGSAVTGKEIVYLDDRVVAEKRSFGRKSCLAFKFDNLPFEIEFNQVNLFTGELHCSLIKEGVHVKTFKRALKKENHLTVKNVIKLFSLGVGISVGFTGALYLGEFIGFWQIDTLLSIFN